MPEIKAYAGEADMPERGELHCNNIKPLSGGFIIFNETLKAMLRSPSARKRSLALNEAP